MHQNHSHIGCALMLALLCCLLVPPAFSQETEVPLTIEQPLFSDELAPGETALPRQNIKRLRRNAMVFNSLQGGFNNQKVVAQLNKHNEIKHWKNYDPKRHEKILFPHMDKKLREKYLASLGNPEKNSAVMGVNANSNNQPGFWQKLKDRLLKKGQEAADQQLEDVILDRME
jgi:hypothetical protein